MNISREKNSSAFFLRKLKKLNRILFIYFDWPYAYATMGCWSSQQTGKEPAQSWRLNNKKDKTKWHEMKELNKPN